MIIQQCLRYPTDMTDNQASRTLTFRIFLPCSHQSIMVITVFFNQSLQEGFCPGLKSESEKWRINQCSLAQQSPAGCVSCPALTTSSSPGTQLFLLRKLIFPRSQSPPPFSALIFLNLERKWKVFGGDKDLRFVFNHLLGPCLQHYEGTGQQALAVRTQLFNDLEDWLQQLYNE